MTASSLLSSTNNAMDLKATAGSRGDSGNDSTTEPVASTSTSPAGVGNVPMPGGFDIVQHYAELLQKDEVRELLQCCSKATTTVYNGRTLS